MVTRTIPGLLLTVVHLLLPGCGGGAVDGTEGPGVVAALEARGGPGCVTLTWSDDTPAASFTVYAALSPEVAPDDGTGVSGGIRSEGAASPHVVDGLEPGVERWFVVTITVEGVEGPPSPVVSAVPLASGPFARGFSFGVGIGPVSLAAGDLDNDGDLDLVTANRTAGTVSVLRGRFDGTFAAAVDLPVGPGPRSSALAPFDADGNLDLAVPPSSAIWTATGSPTSSSWIRWPSRSGFSWGTASGGSRAGRPSRSRPRRRR
jgi:hypothetical protein